MGVQLGCDLGAVGSGAVNCVCPLCPAAGPLVVSSARLRRGRSRQSSARGPCCLPTRRSLGGLRREVGGSGRVGGCLQLCRRRRVEAFVRWSGVRVAASHLGRLSTAWRLSWTKGLERAAGADSNLRTRRCRLEGRLRLRSGNLRRPSSGELLRELSLRKSFTA